MCGSMFTLKGSEGSLILLACLSIVSQRSDAFSANPIIFSQHKLRISASPILKGPAGPLFPRSSLPRLRDTPLSASASSMEMDSEAAKNAEKIVRSAMQELRILRHSVRMLARALECEPANQKELVIVLPPLPQAPPVPISGLRRFLQTAMFRLRQPTGGSKRWHWNREP